MHKQQLSINARHKESVNELCIQASDIITD